MTKIDPIERIDIKILNATDLTTEMLMVGVSVVMSVVVEVEETMVVAVNGFVVVYVMVVEEREAKVEEVVLL